MNLNEIKKHMVDLRRSEYDKERSSPKDGKYVWSKKVILNSKDYKDSNTRPRFKYRWVAFDDKNDFAQYNNWVMNYSATPARWDDKETEVYPEPLVPNPEGNYRYMDMILMKIPLEVEVDRQLENRERYDKAARGLQKKFNATAGAEQADSKDSTVYDITKG